MENKPSATPASVSTGTSEKQRLVTDIREFVGKGGYLPFEHGFRPSFNAYAIYDEKVYLRAPTGKRRMRTIPLEELDERQLTILIVDVFRYMNHCHLRA